MFNWVLSAIAKGVFNDSGGVILNSSLPLLTQPTRSLLAGHCIFKVTCSYVPIIADSCFRSDDYGKIVLLPDPFNLTDEVVIAVYEPVKFAL